MRFFVICTPFCICDLQYRVGNCGSGNKKLRSVKNKNFTTEMSSQAFLNVCKDGHIKECQHMLDLYKSGQGLMNLDARSKNPTDYERTALHLSCQNNHPIIVCDFFSFCSITSKLKLTFHHQLNHK